MANATFTPAVTREVTTVVTDREASVELSLTVPQAQVVAQMTGMVVPTDEDPTFYHRAGEVYTALYDSGVTDDSPFAGQFPCIEVGPGAFADYSDARRAQREVESLLAEVARLQAEVATARRENGNPLPFVRGDEGVRDLIESGKLIHAIKRTRRLTGASLIDAKAAVEHQRDRMDKGWSPAGCAVESEGYRSYLTNDAPSEPIAEWEWLLING